MNQRSLDPILAIALAVIGILLGGYGLVQYTRVQADMAALSASSQANMDAMAATAAAAVSSVGVAATPEPAHPTDVDTVAHDPSDLPPPLNRTEPETVKITLTAHEVTAQLADGTTYDFWTFDNKVPGPMLRVMVGDTVELTLDNPAENTVGHNIDLHAVNGPGGGANVTNVMPGESATVTFKALNPGVYVYHCAFAPPQHHIAQGMYGAILVEPVGGLPPVDREFYVMQGEWYTVARGGTQGHQLFSSEKALAEEPEYFTFNGHVNALTTIQPLEAEVGENIRIFFGVGGPNVGSNFHIIGEIFDRVFTGAPDHVNAVNEETWYVPPGSVSTIELGLDEPGDYLLVDHALYRTQKGAAGILRVTGDWDPEVYMPEAAPGGH